LTKLFDARSLQKNYKPAQAQSVPDKSYFLKKSDFFMGKKS